MTTAVAMLVTISAELEDRAELQARVGTGPGDEAHVGPARAESVDEEESGRDARNERADEQPAEDPSGSPSIQSFVSRRLYGRTHTTCGVTGLEGRHAKFIG